MKFRYKALIFLAVLATGAFLMFKTGLLNFDYDLSLELAKLEKGIRDLAEFSQQRIFTPSPISSFQNNQQSFLTKEGVIKWTNIQRKKYGLAELVENERLNLSSQAKAMDMFDNQYFAHDSPSGIEVKDVIEASSYKFIIVGENLAMGDFVDDEILVQAWMDSPGHRENILNSDFQEIGVSVIKGTFEGKEVWMAVQHFGLPSSVCPKVNENLEAEIDLKKSQVEQVYETLVVLEGQIKSIKTKRNPLYTEAVEKYNSLVAQYNSLAQETDALIKEYNEQVVAFNQCVAGIVE